MSSWHNGRLGVSTISSNSTVAHLLCTSAHHSPSRQVFGWTAGAQRSSDGWRASSTLWLTPMGPHCCRWATRRCFAHVIIQPRNRHGQHVVIPHELLQVLAAVFGPHEPANKGQASHDRCTIHCELAMAAFSTGERRRRGKSDRRITEMVGLVQSAIEQTVLLELMPRSQVDVTIQVRAAHGAMWYLCKANYTGTACDWLPLRDPGVH